MITDKKRADALALRKKINRRRPRFVRQDPNLKRISTSWRRPKGIHSKMRHQFSGQGAVVKVGYRSPVLARGVHRSGLMPVIVANKKDLEGITHAGQCAVFASSLGMRKRLELVAYAREHKITVLNIKDADAYAARVKSAITARKSARKERLEIKDREQKIASKKEKTDKEKAAAKAPDAKTVQEIAGQKGEAAMDQKEIEKKEHDKFLTKRDV